MTEARHDKSYRLLFSNPRMIEDLLRGFVHEEWVGELDFTTLERLGGSFVSEDLQDRRTDLVWRLRWRGGWLYLYLLLEFQSTVDEFMALRMMTYLGLLYQDLLRRGQRAPSGKLPPVLPLVLYNGGEPWWAAEEVARLIETPPGGLERYRPSLRYLLLDEGRCQVEGLAPMGNLVAALFALEQSRSPAQMERAVGVLLEQLRGSRWEDLRRAFTVWLRRVLLPARVPGVTLPSVRDLQEVKTMLAERVVEWTEEWKEKGLREGRKQGRKEGRKEGRKQGVREGEARLLLRLLERKFGPVDARLRRRIEGAEAERLLEWGERLLVAGDPEEIFGPSETD